MAHSLSAKKRIRQNEKRRLRNQARKTLLKTLRKNFLAAIRDGNLEEAEKRYRMCCKHYDRIAAKGTIHRNAAARYKSKLAKKLSELKAKLASTPA